jgi:PiT family inorganic phosphate transporter
LNFVVMVVAGAVVGAILWMASRQKADPSLVPFFLLAGAAGGIAYATFTKAVTMGGLTKTLVFMVVSPILGFVVGFLLMCIVDWAALGTEPAKVNSRSRRLQVFSSAFAALTHGTNDAQKTMGVIAVLVVAAGIHIGYVPGTKNLDIPAWIIVMSALAMAVGTAFGGWRIIQTMAARITHLRPPQGFAAEMGGGVVLVAMAQAGIPVSTTHAISSSIMGVGSTQRAGAVRWAVGRRIVGAWILTIPASALVAFLVYYAVHAVGG